LCEYSYGSLRHGALAGDRNQHRLTRLQQDPASGPRGESRDSRGNRQAERFSFCAVARPRRAREASRRSSCCCCWAGDPRGSRRIEGGRRGRGRGEATTQQSGTRPGQPCAAVRTKDPPAARPFFCRHPPAPHPPKKVQGIAASSTSPLGLASGGSPLSRTPVPLSDSLPFPSAGSGPPSSPARLPPRRPRASHYKPTCRRRALPSGHPFSLSLSRVAPCCPVPVREAAAAAVPVPSGRRVCKAP
jgi:hypothetical protein